MFDVNRLSITQPLVENAISLPMSFKDNTFSEHSYFIEAVEFCKKMDEEMFEQNRTFYRCLTESGDNDTIIMEGFSDWFSGFKNIIKKIIDFLHALLNKFLVGLNMLFKRESYLRDHKKDLWKFNENHKFHISIYKFTIDNVPVPQDSVLRDFKTGSAKLIFSDKDDLHGVDYESILKDRANNFEERNNEIVRKTGYTPEKSLKDIKDAYDKFSDALNDGTYYDYIRGEILGQKGIRIDAADFSKELFEVFRDGQSAKEDTEIEANEVHEAWNRFSNYEKIKKETTKRKNNVEKEYKSIQKKIEHSVKVNGEKLTYSSTDGTDVVYNIGSEVARKYESMIKMQATAIQEISNLHTTAFAARLDAYKDQFNQDKTILYKALYRILGNIKTGERGK